MAKKKKNSDGYDGDSYDDDGGQLNLDDMLFSADQRHYRDTEQYVASADRLYNQAVKKLTELATQVGNIPQNHSFSFKHNKAVAQKVQQTILDLASGIESVVDAGCRHEWDAACIKGDQYIEKIRKTADLSEEKIKTYQDRNLESLAAFQERKVEGLNLSERVWKMVSPLKEEVELVVDTSAKYYDHGVGINTKDAVTKIQESIGNGTSAAELSRQVRECLREPNKLFRRVKDKYGNLTLSKAAQLYHPGQGVYRSSYKNAMRMCRSEINMAYRQSDTMRWQQLDFVVGMEVNLSNNHTTKDPKSKGVIKLVDICDQLKGKYPKDFKFVGWHPQCRCYVTPIMKSREEMNRDRQNMDDPDYVPKESENAVNDVPDNYKKYMQDNAERIAGWSSTPYYIKDNPQYFDKAIHPEKYKGKGLVLSDDQTKTISIFQSYANNHQDNDQFSKSLENLLKSKERGDSEEFYAHLKRTAAIYNQEPEGHSFIDTTKLSREDKHHIYEKPLDFQFIEVDNKGAENKIFLHILKGYHEEDYLRLIKAARLYAKDGDVYILPEIHESEKGIRKRLGIETTTKVPDLKTSSGFVDAKSPKNSSNIGRNANLASSQGAIACITDDRCKIKRESVENIARRVINDKSYSKDEVHFIINGELIKCNGQGIIPGQGSASSRDARNGYMSLRGAKVNNNSEISKDLGNNSALNQQNRRLLIRKRTKSAKEQRHVYDSRIEELKAKAQKYHLDTEAIEKAYTALDLKKIEQTISEQERVLAKRIRVYAQVEKKHAQRTPEMIKDIKYRAAERHEALEAIKFIESHKVKTMKVPNSADRTDCKTLKDWHRAIDDLTSQYTGVYDWDTYGHANDLSYLKVLYDQIAEQKLKSRINLANQNLKDELEWAMDGINLMKVPHKAVIQLQKYLKNIDLACERGMYKLSETEIDGIKNLKKLIDKKADFSKISTNMPVELLPKSSALYGEEYTFDKRLFDSIGRYIKLVDDGIEGAYFTKTYNMVHHNSIDKRYAKSPYEQKKVIYHEFGHASHWCNDYYDNESVQKLMDEHVKTSLKKYGLANLDKDLQRLYYSRKTEYLKYKDIGCKNEYDFQEMVMNIMDTVQAMTQGKHGCINIDGHDKSYWNKRSSRETEFVAHMSENFYIGNPLFEKLLPELYKAMIATFKYH